MKLLLIKFIISSIILLIGHTVLAQDKKIIIKGKVIDEISMQPLSGANIFLQQSAYGTISNNNGEFSISVPADGVIQVSYLGYRLQSLSVFLINDPYNLLISLKKSDVNLDEVTIKVWNPSLIIKGAIERIPQNYLNRPHITKGFYRTSMRRGNEYIELSEAVFDIYNYGYAVKQKNLLRLEKMRAIKDEQITRDLKIGLRPTDIFESDVVKRISDHTIFSEKNLKKYDFKVNGIVDYQGYRAYEISFDQKDGIKEALNKGRVFIDAASYAFIAFDYKLSPKGLSYARYGTPAQRLLMQIMDIHISSKNSDHQIVYRKISDRWVLSMVKSRSTLSFKSTRKNYNYMADLDLNYLVTDVDTVVRAPFTEKEILSNNNTIELQDTGIPGDFWKDYTILLPDFNVETIAGTIKAKNDQYNIKSQAFLMLNKMPKNSAVRVDSLLHFYNQKEQFNGTALIHHNGQVLLSKSYGLADMEKQLQADSNTLYRVGSLSKSFTAILICQLAYEGKLDLQVPIKTYLPYYHNGNVTIEQLLTHRSGIPNYTTNEAYLGKIISHRFSLKDLVINFCSDSLDFISGTEFKYSNSGYAILALLAEEITGKPFDMLLEDRIFKPLQMTDTYSGKSQKTSKNHAIGYYYGKPEPVYNPENVAGSGAVTSTAADLLKYALALETEKLLPKNKILELFKPRAEYKDWGADYGYGWMIDRYQFLASKKHTVIYHPGTDFGFYSMFIMMGDTQIILLNNTGTFPRFDMADLILDIVSD